MLSEVTHVVSDTSVDAYAFTFDWVRASHIHCSINGTELTPGDAFEVSGDSGAATLTIVGTPFADLEILDEIRIWKETPQTFDTRTVDFAASGVVSEDTMDDAIKHCIALSQDLSDELDTALKYNSDDEYDAGSKKIINALPGENATDVATVGQITSIVADAGSLPGATDFADGSILVVNAGDWEVQTADTAVTSLGIGTAGLLDTGELGGNIRTNTQAEATYLQILNNLTDLDDVDAARTALELGTAAVKDTGVLAGQIVELDLSARLPAVDGSLLDLTGHALSGRDGGLLDVMGWFQFTAGQSVDQGSTYPVPSTFLTNSARNLDVDTGRGLTAFRNTSTDIAISGTNDTFTLKTGTWVIDLDLVFHSTPTAFTNTVSLGFGLVKHSDGTVMGSVSHYGGDWAMSDFGSATYGGDKLTVHRKILLTLASNTELAVRAEYKESSGTHGVKLLYGQVFVHKLED